jgi:hypothetical protein
METQPGKLNKKQSLSRGCLSVSKSMSITFDFKGWLLDWTEVIYAKMLPI